MLHLEFRLRFGVVRAATEDGGIGGLEFLDGVTKLGRFCRSTGCVRLWIKIQNKIFPAIVPERSFATLIVLHVEIRSLVTFFEHCAVSAWLEAVS